jgi:hypothetical protein
VAGEKRSNVEVEAIVNQICLLMIKGITRRVEIWQYMAKMDELPQEEQSKRNWIPIGDKSDRQIDIYIQRAKEAFLEMGKEDRENVRAMYIAQLEDMYQEARRTGKLSTANNIMKNKLYLQGLGGMNIHGSFNIGKFDIVLSPVEEEAYKNRVRELYGEDFAETIKPDMESQDDD